MTYIVLDLEFNQPFRFKRGFQTTLHPECPFEIIQIGAVKLDDTFTVIDTFNAFIKPVIYPRIHPYVEKITHLTYAQLKDAPTFPYVYETFSTFQQDETAILCAWGSDDIKSLFRNILFYRLDATAISNQYLNIQKFASAQLQQEAGQNIGLKNAVTELQLTIEEPFHDALNDAMYTAKVFQKVHPQKIQPEIFHVADILRKNTTTRLSVKDLLEHFENHLQRPLSSEEKMLVKKAYHLGHAHAFDVPKKKPSL